jgi:hypothetical protein
MSIFRTFTFTALCIFIVACNATKTIRVEAYGRAFADFERLQSAGKLKHLPVREFSLDQIAEAHEAVEKGNNGMRMVIVMA